jgi:NTP pyrophosphatase (non-canonical NTP hydrolase)
MTNQEKELLLILQEECAEVIQAVSKIFRFGLDTEWNGETNRQHLEEELGDLKCMIELSTDIRFDLCNHTNIFVAQCNKETKLETYSNIYNKGRTI